MINSSSASWTFTATEISLAEAVVAAYNALDHAEAHGVTVPLCERAAVLPALIHAFSRDQASHNVGYALELVEVALVKIADQLAAP